MSIPDLTECQMITTSKECTQHELMGLCDESRQEGAPLPDDIVPSLIDPSFYRSHHVLGRCDKVVDCCK